MNTAETMKVFQAINAVQADMAAIGIAKTSKNAQQGYAFRGIDAVYGAIAPLLAKHNLVILPKVTSREVAEKQTKSGGVLFYVTVMIEYTMASSVDGSTVVCTIAGEAMDSGDKATNKAMSAAYKYLCLQTFCIPTEGDNDADATTHEVAGLWIPTSQRKHYSTELQRLWGTKDAVGFRQLWDELTQDQKADIWSDFNSVQRKEMKELLEKTNEQ